MAICNPSGPATTSICDLPTDLLPEILSRVPVKSLLQLKCVCKTWYALIKNPSFITKHLDLSTLNTNGGTASLLVEFLDRETNGKSLGLLSENTYDVSADLDLPFDHTDSRFIVAGSCKGLLCLSICSGDRSTILLWNPAMRQYRHLPEPQIVSSPRFSIHGVIPQFGFVADANDYKLVRIVYSFSFTRTAVHVEVYKMSTDSWTTLNTAMPCYIGDTISMEVEPVNPLWIHPGSSPAFVNGAFHWIANDSRGQHNTCPAIMSFDLSGEQFWLITVLDSDRLPYQTGGRLAVLDESLALIVCYQNGQKNIDIWVMNEYGVQESWTKQFTIPSFPMFVVPVGFWKNGVMIMEKVLCTERGAFCYELSTREIKNLPNIGNHKIICIHSYVESLVSIGGGSEVVLEADQ